MEELHNKLMQLIAESSQQLPIEAVYYTTKTAFLELESIYKDYLIKSQASPEESPSPQEA